MWKANIVGKLDGRTKRGWASNIFVVEGFIGSRATMQATETNPEQSGTAPIATGLMYRFSIAFPTWAGAMLALYSIFLRSGNILKIRLK